MGKTTNILDLNNRLEKVEKGNVAQNNYNSLKNRPKINGNLLTGDKTGAQLGLAEAQDIGDMSELETTATNLVGAINEVKSGLTNLLKYKVFHDTASDTTFHLYNTDVSVSQYVCVGGCTPNNPNYKVEISNTEVSVGGYIRYRLYDVANNQVVSDNAAYMVYLVFIDTAMLSELVITP